MARQGHDRASVRNDADAYHLVPHPVVGFKCDDRCLHGNDAAVVRAVYYQERKSDESRSGLHAWKRRTISFNERNKSGEIRHDLADTI